MVRSSHKIKPAAKAFVTAVHRKGRKGNGVIRDGLSAARDFCSVTAVSRNHACRRCVYWYLCLVGNTHCCYQHCNRDYYRSLDKSLENSMHKKGICMKLNLWKILSCAAVTVLFLTGCAGKQANKSVEESIFSDESEDSLLDGEAASSVSDTAESSDIQQENTEQNEIDFSAEEDIVKKMTLQIGNSSFTATLEHNAAVDAFVEMMRDAPVSISMSDYSGFEKVGSLGTSLPADDRQTTTHAGDIVLYNGNQIVIFYGSNSWSYTRLGTIDDLSGWEEALGSGDVMVTFSLI